MKVTKEQLERKKDELGTVSDRGGNGHPAGGAGEALHRKQQSELAEHERAAQEGDERLLDSIGDNTTNQYR